MGSTYSNLLAHIVFSTKHREPLITAAIKPRLYAYIGGICRELDSTLLAAGGIEDHIHLLVRYPPRMAASDLLRVVKSNSSGWVHDEFKQPFGWQTGYGIFSIGENLVGATTDYIASQEEHHRTVTFQDEFRAFLQRHNIPYDERYIWD